MNMWKMLDKFRVEVMDSSSDEESDHTTQTMATVVASMLHGHGARQMPVHRGSMKICSKNLSCNRVEGNLWLHNEYIPPHRSGVLGEKNVPAPVQAVKGPVHGHSTGRL
jgi:hypothetical protein